MSASSPDEPEGGVESPRSDRPAGASSLERLASLGIFAAVAAVTVVAWSLEPDPTGLGTHRQLGFPPCGFYDKLGIPCLSCGWTTAWSALANLKPLQALAASPFGALAMLLVLAAGIANLWSALTGWSFFRFVERLDHVRFGLACVVLMIASWLYKVALCGRF